MLIEGVLESGEVVEVSFGFLLVTHLIGIAL